ncbi:polyprenyl synthetase family protein [Chloroflexota bacterium]
MTLAEIYEPIEKDLGRVEKNLRSISEIEYPHLSELLSYILIGGKGIRPALTLLSGKFYNYGFDRLLPMASAVELLHIATLVHDDAIDKSEVRRGRATINSLWDEERAILLGDYLFAKAGEFAASTQNLRAITLFSQTLQIISSGELNQIFNAFNPEQTRDDYMKRISSKTASLFLLATESGAVLSQAPEESVEVLKEYGFNLGIAFQIIDDILDFIGSEEEMGKPIGSDLTQGTLTLPAMLLLEHHPDDNPVKRMFQESEDREKNVKLAIEMVRNSKIVEQCYDIASGYCNKACQHLLLLPDKASHQALLKLSDYVITRKR